MTRLAERGILRESNEVLNLASVALSQRVSLNNEYGHRKDHEVARCAAARYGDISVLTAGRSIRAKQMLSQNLSGHHYPSLQPLQHGQRVS